MTDLRNMALQAFVFSEERSAIKDRSVIGWLTRLTNFVKQCGCGNRFAEMNPIPTSSEKERCSRHASVRFELG